MCFRRHQVDDIWNWKLIALQALVFTPAILGNSTAACGNPKPRGEGFVYDVNEEHLNELDTAFVWLRYIHAVVVPILIFVIHKVHVRTSVIMHRRNTVPKRQPFTDLRSKHLLTGVPTKAWPPRTPYSDRNHQPLRPPHSFRFVWHSQ